MESFEDMDGTIVMVHERAVCSAGPKVGCPIHAPSNHEFVHLPLRWRQDVYGFFRVEPNGTQHYDPDAAAYDAKSTRNRALCKRCDTVIESRHQHDFKTCPCGNLSVDGGPAYSRRLVRDGDESWTDISSGMPDGDD